MTPSPIEKVSSEKSGFPKMAATICMIEQIPLERELPELPDHLTLPGYACGRMRRGICVLTLTGLILVVAPAASPAKPTAGSGYTLVENAALVQPGKDSLTAARTISTPDPFTWGAVDLPIPARLRLRQLTHMSTDYMIVEGSCWGGSPRFEAWVTDGTGSWKLHFYIGPPPSWVGCPEGDWENSGNLASSNSQVDASQVGGSHSDNYGDVQVKYGNYEVTHVYADLDGGWNGDQTVDFDNTQVNRQLVTYER